MRKASFIFGVFLSFSLTIGAFTIPVTPLGQVNDYANILSVEAKQKVEGELRSFTASTTNEIAVVTIPDLGGDTVEHYATKLFESWKIGTAKNDNGVLLLIARDEHKLRIEVGYGLEGALPDILTKDIIDNQITPLFKKGDYDTGVIQGVQAIMKATRGEYTTQTSTSKKGNTSSSDLFIFIVIFGIQGLLFLSAILGRSKSWWAGGVVGGVAGVVLTLFGVFGGVLIISGLITFSFIVIGLILDYFVSKTYISAVSQGNSIPWWIGGGKIGGGGWSSSSGGGRSSFGGFSGGSSGGGGSSGSW